MDTVTLTCVAGINKDYITAKRTSEMSQTFLLTETDKLRDYLEERQINPEIVRGMNVFAGRLLNDNEFSRFQDVICEVTGCKAIS